MADKETLLIETHGMVREMSGKIGTIERDLRNGKEARKRIHTRQDKMEEEYVPKAECAATEEKVTQDIKVAVSEAINGKKRSRWLVIKDLLLILFSSGGVGTIVILALLGKLK